MSAHRRAVITGRGVLSAIGCAWPSFARAIRDETTAPIGDFPGSLLDVPVSCHPLSQPELLTKRASEPLSALTIVAAELAAAEAGIPANGTVRDDIGLVISTVLGPSTAVEAYLEQLRADGSRAARPALFVDTLLSMPASRTGIVLGLRGSTAVLGGSSPFELALDWLRAGREHTVIAGGVEYQSRKCLRYQHALAARSGHARPLPAQGAAVLVLEELTRARERDITVLAELLGAGAASEPQEVALPWSSDPDGRAFARAMRDALADAALEPHQLSIIALAGGDDAAERGELNALESVVGSHTQSLTLLRPKRLLGEALGAAGGLALLATIAHIEACDASEPVFALVNSFEMGGAVTSLVLRPPAS